MPDEDAPEKIDADARQEYLEPDPGMVTFRPSYITLGEMQVEPANVVRFLSHLSITGNVSESCRLSKISRSTVHRLCRRVPEFKEAWDSAMESSKDVLEREAFRRAVEGVKRPVFQGGRLVGHVRNYSDALLKTMLQARHPDYHRETAKVEVNNNNAQVTVVEGPPVPNDADLAEYVQRLGEVAAKHLPASVDNQVEREWG